MSDNFPPGYVEPETVDPWEIIDHVRAHLEEWRSRPHFKVISAFLYALQHEKYETKLIADENAKLREALEDLRELAREKALRCCVQDYQGGERCGLHEIVDDTRAEESIDAICNRVDEDEG